MINATRSQQHMLHKKLRPHLAASNFYLKESIWNFRQSLFCWFLVQFCKASFLFLFFPRMTLLLHNTNNNNKQRLIQSTSVLFSPPWFHIVHLGSIWSTSVHFVRFGLIRSYSIHFGSLRSYSVHYAYFGLIQSYSIYFGPIQSTLILFSTLRSYNLIPFWSDLLLFNLLRFYSIYFGPLRS